MTSLMAHAQHAPSAHPSGCGGDDGGRARWVGLVWRGVAWLTGVMVTDGTVWWRRWWAFFVQSRYTWDWGGDVDDNVTRYMTSDNPHSSRFMQPPVTQMCFHGPSLIDDNGTAPPPIYIRKSIIKFREGTDDRSDFKSFHLHFVMACLNGDNPYVAVQLKPN